MVDRISSLDLGYNTGDLSIYPLALDNSDVLFRATNNAETYLTQSLTFNGKIIVVNDTSLFPDKGILRIGPPAGSPGISELIYYNKKTTNTFQDLKRAYAGSRQNIWPIKSWVNNGVNAEYHNALKDAIINIENNLGTVENPATESLNGLLKQLENKFLLPKPLFKAFPRTGPPSLKVRFQNFITGRPLRILWDFGDGTTSVEANPIHTYHAEGMFTVTLNVLSSTGGQGVMTKSNYIKVDSTLKEPFFYVSPYQGNISTVFTFIDQTDGDIFQRFWLFDDGTTERIDDPNIHTIEHQYSEPGIYKPSLLVIFADQTQKRTFLVNNITVT